MKWNAELDRINGSHWAKIDLWEMPVGRIEAALRMCQKSLAEHMQQWHMPPGPGQPHYIRVFWMAWCSVTRKLRVAVLLLDRELRYRSDAEYRGFCASIRMKPADTTIPLVFADWCQEKGYHVMARRLRRKVTGQPQSRRKTRHRY